MYKSKTWDYFTKNAGQESATCSRCGVRIKVTGGNTRGMINHLKLHDINFNTHENINSPSLSTTQASSSTVSTSAHKRAKNEPIFKFLIRESLNEILAKCSAWDGFSFRAISRSEAIKGYVLSKNYEMPKSETTIRGHVMQFAEEKKASLKQTFSEMLTGGKKFSISVDEWTNNSNTRFLNITVHDSAESYSLGLTKINGSCDAKETERLVSATLNEFGLSLTSDIVGSTHDGASVMVKYGNDIPPESQLCYNHAIHLAVISVFYDKSKSGNNEDESDVDEDEDGESNDNFDDIIRSDANLLLNHDNMVRLNFADNIAHAIGETRRICKFFRKSSVRNNCLQKHVVEHHGKPLMLLLDVKTRWNSLMVMINRFLLISDCVILALEELGAAVPSQENLCTLKYLLAVLEPLEKAVIELSKENSNLLIAEGTMKFVFSKLRKIGTPLALQMLFELKKRIDERRITPLISLLMFLNNASYARTNEDFQYSSKIVIKAYGEKIYARLFPVLNAEDSNSEINQAAHQSSSDEDVDDRLDKSIFNFLLPPKENLNPKMNLAKELKIMEGSAGIRTLNLEALYQALLTIKPTSVSCERTFSVAGNFCTKIRSSLSPTTLSNLVYLKYHFLKNKKHFN